MSQTRTYAGNQCPGRFAIVRSAIGWLRQALERLPAEAWSKGLVLFGVLVAIKCALLIHFGKDLYQTHWRVALPETTALGQGAWILFVIIGVCSLCQVAGKCVEVKQTRVANAVVLVLGLLFIFLTFHSGESNFLFPILTGVLPWGSLGPYLSLKLCFEQPYLAAWLFAYAAGYYVLARTGRERLVLRMTAVFGGAYGLCHLRELAAMPDELLLLDCLGFAAVAINLNAGRLKPSFLYLAPVTWCVVTTTFFFQFAPREMGPSFTYFLLLASASGLLFVGSTLLAWRRGLLGTWLVIVPFFALAFLLLSNSHHPMAQNFNRAITVGLEVPHYFLGELCLAASYTLSIALLPRSLGRIGGWIAIVVALALILLALVDFRIAQLLGVRLGWDVLALGGNATMMWRMAAPYLPVLLCGTGVLAALFVFGSRWIVDRSHRRSSHPECLDTKQMPANGCGLVYAVGCFIALGLVGAWLVTPDKAAGQVALSLVKQSTFWKSAFNRPLGAEQIVAQARELGIETVSHSRPSAAQKRDLNVLLIFLESTYNKHLSLFGAAEETQPLLSRYKDRMELYPNFFSTFASSIHARFATFTSLYPVKDYNAFTLERVPVKSLFEVMHGDGYHCSLYYSSYLDFTGFRSFLANRGIDELHDADTMPGAAQAQRIAWGLPEEVTLRAMQSRIQNYAKTGQRFFMTYVPAAPHYPYDCVPQRFLKYKPGAPGDYKPLYLNELLYMDWVMASLLDELKSNGLLDKTLVVITDDHGEMLGGEGQAIGHGWWLTPELANAPLIVMDPARPGYKVNYKVGTQVDLLPTLLDLAGVPVPQNELYQGRSLLAPDEANRVAWLNAFQHYATLTTNTLVFGDRDKKGRAKTGVAYAIRNDGARTIFEPQSDPVDAPHIEEFDRFQEGLLKNYDSYRKVLEKPAAGIARSN